jgi:hypothetical protein
MRWLAIVAILVSLQGQVAHVPGDGLSRIHLTFLNCAGAAQSGVVPKLIVVDIRTFQDVDQAQYTVKKIPLGFDVEILTLAQGFYELDFSVGECGGTTLLPVLKGRDQDALLIGSQLAQLRESVAMVAGTLPFSGYTASIAYWPQDQVNGVGPKSLLEDPARVQGDSYYATGLPAGIARLRIRTPDGTQYLEFNIGKIGSNVHRVQVFNITEADLKNALEQKAIMRVITPRKPGH